jgi:4-amino-4-deoxy-L-arabinose transferase-like glycosyltransferase
VRRYPAVIAAAVLGADVLISFRYEHFQPVALLLAALAFAAFVYITGWWRQHKILTVTLGVNVALIFLYLWSLDERVHIVIRATPSGYTATVGDDMTTLLMPPRAGWFGLRAGPEGDYRVQTTGQVSTPDQTSLVGRLDQYIRFAAPRPAWASFQIHPDAGGQQPVIPPSRTDVPSGSWAINRRGEIEGDLGTYTLLGRTPKFGYTIQVDLMRADGTQGILLGLDSQGNGLMFAPRFDQPDALWYNWGQGQAQNSIAGTSIHVTTLNMVQRDLRLVLGSFIAALLILLLAVPAYYVFAGLNRLVGGSDGRELDRVSRLLRPRLLDLAAAGAAVAAVVVTALFASSQLERIPHVQDSVANLFQAKTLALGRFSVPKPPLLDFFMFDNFHAHNHFVLAYDGRWFGIYEPGWPILLAIGVKLDAGWLVNPLITGADLFLIYLIGREAYGRRTALIGALLALSSPFFLFLGGDYMAHAATLLYLCGFAALFVRWVRRSEPWTAPIQHARILLVPAGFLLAMGFATRQADAIMFALPLVFLVPVRQWKHQIRAVGWLAAGAAAPLLFLLAYNWNLTGNPLKSPYTLVDSWNRLGFGKGIGFTGNFTLAQGLWNTSYNLESLMTHLFGWPFYVTLALAAIPFVTGRASRWDVSFALSALAIMLVYVAYWGDGVMYGPRYYYAALPWFVLLTARGLEELFRWLLRLPVGISRDRLAALTVTGLIVMLLLVCDLNVYIPAQIPLYPGYNYSSAAPFDAVSKAGIHHAIVFVANPENGWYAYGIPFSANSPLLDNDVLFARDLGTKDRQLMRLYPGRTAYLLNGTTVSRLKL